MTVATPPRRPDTEHDRDLERRVADLEALIEEARRRARRRRMGIGVMLVAVGTGVAALSGLFGGGGSAGAKPLTGNPGTRGQLSGASTVRSGRLTLFVAPGTAGLASIVTVAGRPSTTISLCPRGKWCGENVSFAWAPGGRRVAYSLDEIAGNSTFIGLHVFNVRSGRDTRIPEGAPKTATFTDTDYPAVWAAYSKRTQQRVGCLPAAELAWSPDGSSLAYICGPDQITPIARAVYQLEVLKLRGSGHTTVPTGTPAFWPSWSASGTRIAYSSDLHPTPNSRIYTIALDGSNRHLVARGAAPAWSPDGRTIAYQTTCGIRLVTPFGRNVTPTETAKACGAIGVSGPPVWSPDGTQLAVETAAGVYVMDKNGGALHLVSHQATTTWRGGLPGRPSWQPIH